MKMCFKFRQKCTTNEEFDFWGVQGGGVSQFQKFGNASYRMMVPLHTERLRTLESRSIIKHLNLGGTEMWGERSHPDPFLEIFKMP